MCVDPRLPDDSVISAGRLGAMRHQALANCRVTGCDVCGFVDVLFVFV